MCSNVLLPEPDGPITAVNVPVANAAVTPRRARTQLSPLPYSFETDSSWTAGRRSTGADELDVDRWPGSMIA